MRYQQLNISTSLAPEYCYCGKILGGEGGEHLIAAGEPAARLYPSDPYDVQVHLPVEDRGLNLPSRLANTQRLLIFSSRTFAALSAELDLGKCETHPFLLINHKRRVHSRDYLFINPLERRAIAHEASEFKIFESTGRIFDCKRWVLAADKLEGAPDLLRSAELPYDYFVSERFVETVARLGLGNFDFVEVEHR